MKFFSSQFFHLFKQTVGEAHYGIIKLNLEIFRNSSH